MTDATHYEGCGMYHLACAKTVEELLEHLDEAVSGIRHAERGSNNREMRESDAEWKAVRARIEAELRCRP